MDDRPVLIHLGRTDRTALAGAALELWRERLNHRAEVPDFSGGDILHRVERAAIISLFACDPRSDLTHMINSLETNTDE